MNGDDNFKEFLAVEIEKMKHAGFTEIDPDDLAERIIKQRDKIARSEFMVRGWAFMYVRKRAYDSLHTRRAMDNPKLTSQINCMFPEYLPEWIPAKRGGKPKLILLDYKNVFLEEINKVISEEKKEIAAKSLTVTALESWRDEGIKKGKLKHLPKQAGDEGRVN